MAKTRIMLVQGSTRHEDDCPGQNPKSYRLMLHLVKKFKDSIDFDVLDLRVSNDRPVVQPCKGCVSTAGGSHCHFNESEDLEDEDDGCDCYSKNRKRNEKLNGHKRDLLKEQNFYSRIKRADALLVITPVRWYASTDQIKTMFDRLVCCNATMTTKQVADIVGEDNTKNPEKTRPMDMSGQYDHLLKNHLEGLIASFFMHGDGGADDYLRMKPPSTYDAEKEVKSIGDPKNYLLPIVWQCKYCGIDAPEELRVSNTYNVGESYAESNDNLGDKFFEDGERLVMDIVQYLESPEKMKKSRANAQEYLRKRVEYQKRFRK